MDEDIGNIKLRGVFKKHAIKSRGYITNKRQYIKVIL